MVYVGIYRFASCTSRFMGNSKDYSNRARKNKQYEVLIDNYNENFANAGNQ